MFKRITALIWLRGQILLTNKSILISILLPFGLVLLFHHLMNGDGLHGKNLLYSYLPMAFSFSAGVPISSAIAEEKEKRTFKTLQLSGVRHVEYLLSVLFYPVLFVTAAIILFPIMVKVDLGQDYLIYLGVTALSALCMIFLNLIIGAMSETQTQAQVNGLIPMLILTMLPIFSQVSSLMTKLLNLTFLNVYVAFFTKGREGLTMSAIALSFLWMIALLFLSLWSLQGKTGEKRNFFKALTGKEV